MQTVKFPPKLVVIGLNQTPHVLNSGKVIHQTGMCPQAVSRRVAHSLTRSIFQRAPQISRKLRRNPRTGLPQPHVKIVTQELAPCRLEDHY